MGFEFRRGDTLASRLRESLGRATEGKGLDEVGEGVRAELEANGCDVH